MQCCHLTYAAVCLSLVWTLIFMVRVCKNNTRQWTFPVPSESNGDKTKQELTWEVPPVPPKPSRLVYLVQAESCLPDDLKSTVIFRNSTACKCDVVVLSYRQACSDPSPAHVEYISASSPTSWNEGRNLLFDAAKQRKEKYLYYVFMDDDINLEAKAKYVGDRWRIFSEELNQQWQQ